MRKHIIFDFGAVVFRWQPHELLAQVFPDRVTSHEAAASLMGRIFKGYAGVWGRFDAGLIEVPELIVTLAQQSGLSESDCAALIEAIPAHLTVLDDTAQLIDDLAAAGHRLFYLSNMPAPYADFLEQQRAVVRRFEDGVFSARVHLTKPDPAIFHHAWAQFGVEAGDCIFLDDHPDNVAAARALGMSAVLFTNAAQARRDLRELGA